MLPGTRGPRGDLGQAVERAQQRRLARARGADQRQDLALPDGKADVAHDPVLAVGEPHALQSHALEHALRRTTRAARARGEMSARALAVRRRRGSRRWRRWGRDQARCAGSAAASAGPCPARRSAGRPAPRPPALACAPRQAGHDRVQCQHDHQQHESRGIRLLRAVALARGRVVVDVARERRAGATRASPEAGRLSTGSFLQRGAEQNAS